MQKAKAEDNIRPSGVALSKAQRWLRLSDASQALQDDTSLPEDFDEPRPLGLGLGAKVKPEQHKAADNVTALESRLGKRLRDSATRDAVNTGKFQAGADNSKSGTSRGRSAQSGTDVSDSDEEEGRGGAFQKATLQPRSNVWALEAQGAKTKKSKKQQRSQQSEPG